MTRPRILDVAPTAHGYVGGGNDFDRPPTPARELPDGDTFDIIAAELGVTRQRVQQLEVRALEKLRLAIALEEHLGVASAAPVLAALRGRGLSTFRAVLARARGEGEW